MQSVSIRLRARSPANTVWDRLQAEKKADKAIDHMKSSGLYNNKHKVHSSLVHSIHSE